MRAGRLDRSVSFEKFKEHLDPKFGTPVPPEWVRVFTCRAEKRDALPSRSDAVQDGLVVGRNQTRLRMRWRGDITADMRVVLHGDVDVVYQIVGGPAEIGDRRDGIELVLEKYTA